MKNLLKISGLILFAFIIHSCKKDNTSGIPSQGLVAYYPFNGNANDESGNNLNGTVNGATLTTDRKEISEKAYYFNGSSSFIKVPSNTLLSLPKFTIALWVNVERFKGSSAEGSFVFAKGFFPNYNYVLGTGYVNGINTLDASTTTSGDHISFQSSITFNTNTWYFFVVTLDGSNLKTYFDGVLNSSIAMGSAQTNSNDVYIGRYEVDTRWFFKGKIDDIRVYNRALTQTEIQALYKEL